jgi:hypothetical protein
VDVLSLLTRARGVGLEVWADGERLVIRGPKRHGDLARALLEHKAEVMAELRARDRLIEVEPLTPEVFRIRTVDDIGSAEHDSPTRPCWACKSTRWWRLKPGGRIFAGGPWICGVCHPPLPAPDEVEWAP